MYSDYYCKGLSKIEILMAICIVSLLTYFAYKSYAGNLIDSKFNSVKYHASAFSRAVSVYNAQKQIIKANNNKVSESSDKKIFFNVHGWPINTTGTRSSNKKSDYRVECGRLWLMIFKNSSEEYSAQKKRISNKKSEFSTINSDVCRYKLLGGQDESSFFDYHLNTGKVKLPR